MKKISDFFELTDLKYVEFIKRYQANVQGEKVKYLLLHLAPGFCAYIFIYFLRVPIMRTFGLSNMQVQATVLLTMSLGWHIGYPFYVLMKKDKLSFSESLFYLGLKRFDLKGLLTVFPVLTALFFSSQYRMS